MLFSFDGIDGVGKSTQLQLFAEHLRTLGHEVAVCRDPGSTSLGESLREILLHSRASISRRAEMLMYMAARAQLVDEIIRPAIDAGKTVLSDRFLLANVVYQGHAGGLNIDELWEIGRVATQGVHPDLTFVLDLPPEAAEARISRPRDRMESQGDDYRRKLREGFLSEAAKNPERIVVISAAGAVDEVQAAVRQAALKMLPQK